MVRTALFTALLLTVFVLVAGAVGLDTYVEGWISGCGVEGTLWTTCAHRLDATVNQPLVAINWLGDLQPLLAESWEMLEGGKVWIFHLRKGVKWHDGVPFTSEDVVFSFNAYANPRVGSRWASKVADILGYDEFQAGQTDRLIGVEALDDYTVKVELKEPTPIWIKVAQTYVVMLPAHILGNVPPEELRSHFYWAYRIGTGPFKWVEYVPDQYIKLERNEDYFLGAPKIKYLIYRFYSDGASAMAALERGEIDTTAYETEWISLADIQRLDAIPGIDILLLSRGMPNFIRVNHAKPEWADVRVRQAIRYAIDVDTIINTVFAGTAKPAYTIFPQEWAIPEDLNKYEYNPDKARSLLKEAGYDFNRKIELLYHYQDAVTRQALLAIQQYLAQVGINVELRLVDPATIHALQESGKWDMGYFGFGMGLDPALGEQLLRCGTLESGGYCNPEVMTLFAKGKQFLAVNERAPYYHAIARIANQELPQIWLWYGSRALGFNRRVVGPYEHWSEQKIIYFNMPVYQEIEKWYIKQ